MVELIEVKIRKHQGMFHNKKFRRLFRRCSAMTKIASLMMVFIFISGLFNAEYEEYNQAIKSEETQSEVLLARRQRMHEISDARKEDNDVITSGYDVTRMTNITPLNKPLKEEEKIFTLLTSNENPKKSKSEKNGGKSKPAPPIKVKAVANEPIFLNMDYDKMKTDEFTEHENKLHAEWRRRIEEKEFAEVPPNPSFIFHNKLPKSGSSTMNNILKKLSKANHFNFLKMETSDLQTSDDRYLIQQLKTKVKPPFVLLKHHKWLNFTRSNQPQPTYINVMRDPLEWFTSRYYFSRYGWERKPGCRKADCGMSEADRLMDIDECVKKRHRECMNPWMYLQFFCGTAPECSNTTTLEQKERATEIAKSNILNEYYVVGVLEQFEDTLKLFQTMMPDFFIDVIPTWKSEFVQIKQNMTRTTYKKEMSLESKNFFRFGPLHYEIELYNFARELFNKKLEYFHIESTVMT
ncbi:uronyl 2-sulfotransferase-like [Styela clava]